MVPSQQLLGDIIQQRNTPRVIALVADQEPVSSERKHWQKFLNRDTAFFLGAEEIARSARYSAFFVKLKRVARGHYQAEFVPLAAAGEQFPPGEFTGALRAHGRGPDSRILRPTGPGPTSAGSSKNRCTAPDFAVHLT